MALFNATRRRTPAASPLGDAAHAARATGSPQPASESRALRARAGFSLAEVLVALVILTAALLGLALFVSRMAHATSDSRLLGTATELVTNRIETIKSITNYASIDTCAITESTIAGSPDYAGFTRQTLVKHVGGGVADSVDYRIVTVIVTNPVMSAPVKKTTAIAAF
ncbi:MAG: type IV pilus modification PilV family protein [Gemmatimonadaceae bacterium]